jgi:dienelactone hydrolase
VSLDVRSPLNLFRLVRANNVDIHEGTPVGNFEIVHNLRTYISNPKSDKASTGTSGKQDTVIFLSDIFGVDLVNTKLVADEWAGQGYKVLLPDLFDNDPVPHQHLKVSPPTGHFVRERTTDHIGNRT